MAAVPLDMNEFTAKKRNAARRDLLKKIDQYNKKMRKTKEPSFPLSSPAIDLIYKGVLRISYDRGYAIQTKSMLVESDSSSDDLIDQLIDRLGLKGSIDDYALEERNHATQTTRVLSKSENPLNLQLQYGTHSSVLEIRLVQIKDSRTSGQSTHEVSPEEDVDDQLVRARRGSIPKDEVIDHGAANIESMMNEALEDIPTLVSNVQEKLKLLSESLVHEGKPHSKLPSRRELWDTLKPQVSALVKDIRLLVDNEEFLTTKHCPSEEFRLIVTLLLELITDYSRELITVTKELCGLKGAARTDMDTSVSNFVQQINYISKLVERSSDCIHAAALSGHLLHATAPENFLKGPLGENSIFTGSGSISGVLMFTTITAYLGLIRAAYEDKADYYAALANNMLQSTQRALDKIQKSNEYSLIYHHPLRSRVMDMEHKLKVAMDTLVRRVKVAASKKPPPVSVPELLLAGHNLIVATLDFLLVTQCASLLHKIAMTGWDLLQLPWVRGWVSSTAKPDKPVEIQSDPQLPSSHMTDQLSNTSDSATERSFGTASTTSSGHHMSRERRKSRIATSNQKENNDATEYNTAASTSVSLSIEQLTIQPGHLPLNYNGDSGEDADDEAGRSMDSSEKGMNLEGKATKSYAAAVNSPVKPLSPHLFSSGSSQYMGIDAVQRLRKHHILNKAISKIAESLLLKVTQSVNLLSQQCQENVKESYASSVEDIIRAAKHLREEVYVMECDLIGSSNIQETLTASHEQLNAATQALHMSLSSASTIHACDKDRIRLMAAAGHVSEMCSKTIRDALAMVADHRKALVQAEKLEEEFIALMTGHRIKNKTTNLVPSDSSPSVSGRSNRTRTSTVKLPSDYEADSVIFEDIPIKTFMHGGTWTATSATKVIGGTVKQLLQRLTYQRVVDSEFVETFILSYHCLLPNEELLQSLIERYHTKPDSTDVDQESQIESDIVIPIRLRVLHAVRLWLQFHPQDFTSDSSLKTKMEAFLKEIEGEMGTCSRQLQKFLKGDRTSLRPRTNKQSSQPIVPATSEGDTFHIMDCNTLELARQLCLTYFQLFSEIQLKELSMIAWQNERDEQGKLMTRQIPGIQAAKVFSKNLSKVISDILLKEDNEERQSLVISYFIKTAESCHQLKNYEAIAAIVGGVTSESVRSTTRRAWEFISDSQLQTFKSLQGLVSKDFQRYNSEMKSIHFTPCILLMDVILLGISSIHHSTPNMLPNGKDVLNFTKCRQLTKHLKQFYTNQYIPYNFMGVEIIQEFLQTLKQTT